MGRKRGCLVDILLVIIFTPFYLVWLMCTKPHKGNKNVFRSPMNGPGTRKRK